MNGWMSKVRKFLVCEDGPTAVEYAVMLALIVVVCLAAIGSIGTNANTTAHLHAIIARGQSTAPVGDYSSTFTGADVDFKYAEGFLFKLVGAPAACQMKFQRPNDGTANAQKLGEQNFMSGENSNYGAMFANKIMVDCP